MGNTHVKDFLASKDDATNYLKCFMNSELLNHGQFLSERWLSLNVEKHKEYQHLFDWSNVQTTSAHEQIEESIQLQENKENLLVGMLPKIISPDLLNPAFFDDTQTHFSPNDVTTFKDHQNHKFIILYQVFYALQNLRKKEKNIIDVLRSNVKDADIPKAAEVGIRSGIHLIITLLREAAENNSKLKDDTLDFLLELFAEVKPLSLYGPNKIDIVLDKSLHTVADFLEELILSDKTSKDSKCKALKVLFSLGLLRGSLPNLLCVINLIRKLKFEVDLSHELKLLKQVKPDTVFSFEKQLKSHTKIFFTSKLGNNDKQPEKSTCTNITTDGKYLYIHNEIEGLLKIGTGYHYTMFGKVYKHNPDYRLKDKGTLAFVLGKLYYRSSKIAPAPIVEIDIETLEEVETPVQFDNTAPNCLFSDMSNPEIEFPHAQENDDNNGDENKKGQRAKTITEQPTSTNPLKRDIRLSRPPKKSPMFTEGRYLYILSQWTVDSRSRNNGGESDDDDDENSETKQARYGVDIYDPINEFEHVRCVELYDPRPIENKETNKTKTQPPLNVQVLENASFTTNGAQLVVGIPPSCEDNTEIRYKYFNLQTGKLTEASNINEANYFYNICYDVKNNVLWAINDNKKTFDSLACYRNQTIPEKFIYPEESDFYTPYENAKIIEIASEGINIGSKESDDFKKLEKEEKAKEDIQLLLGVGFGVNIPKTIKNTKLKSQENLELLTKATELFILSNISRLAESYASLDKLTDISDDVITYVRRPYSVHLMEKVFVYLEEFVEHYSKSYFDYTDKEYTDDVLYDQCSFLCTLRILKYNLACLEIFNDNINQLGVKIISDDFSNKIQSLIWRIFDKMEILSPARENKDIDDLKKIIYIECLSILKYNLSIIYPDYEKIIYLLKHHLKDLENKKNKDIVISILFWLKNKKNMSKMILYLMESKSPTKLINELKEIIDNIIYLEIKYFIQYMNMQNHLIHQQNQKDNQLQQQEENHNVNNNNNNIYKDDEFLYISMSFLIEYQKEILYQIGQKILEKNLEQSTIHILISNLTESIFKNAMILNHEIQAFLLKMNEIFTKHYENMQNLKEDNKKLEKVESTIVVEEDEKEEEKKIEGIEQKGKEKQKKGKDAGNNNNINKTTTKPKDEKSTEELIKENNLRLWEDICKKFIDKIYFSQVLSMQINTLSLLSSNFLIASKTLKHISTFLTSLNHLYNTRKVIDKAINEKISMFYTEKSETYESEHPYKRKFTKKEKIHLEGAKQLRIVFDPKCDLKQNCDYLQFFSDEKYKQKITEKLAGTGSSSTFPKEDLIIKGDTVYYLFTSDTCSNNNWGYKFSVYAQLQDKNEIDWMTNIHRSACWLAGKCAGQLINGSALQQALLADEEQRYNNLLNSKLFSGGMEKCYFSRGKDGVWSQLNEIINDFEAGHLAEYLSCEINEVEKEEEAFLNAIITGQGNEGVTRVLEFLQKQFTKECLWSSLGGENGAKCVRSVFAVIIKHAGLINDFYDAMLEIEDEEVKKGKLTPNLKNLLKKWHAASRMRTWLVEKRKDIDDLAERNKQVQQTVKTEPENKKTSTSQKKPEKTVKKESKKKKVEEPEKIKPMIEDLESNKQEEPQVSTQIRDSGEIIEKMIDQIMKKAQFLCQLIPAKHWSQDKVEKKEMKTILFRSSSQVEEVNKEEEWKRRLAQWKSVRQSKQVYKSLEDESQEIHLSLTSSVLSCLQSPVSIKRLRKQVESSYLRAICRTIGLNALTSILNGVSSSIFRQDVVGWLCSSLRGTENKLYHFTDNLQGCGHFLESTVNTAFKNLLVAILQSMAKSNSPDEIKCMLESLKWKYHGDDHVFLAEIDLFGILRGNEKQELLRSAWGKSFDLANPSKVDASLVKKLIKLFETVVILCVGKINWATKESQPAQITGKKGKDLPNLERHTSVIDEYSVDILIRQAFRVIFSELDEADKNYRSFKGVNWGNYQRMIRKKEIEAEKRKKKIDELKKKTESNRGRDHYGEEEEAKSEGRSRSRSRDGEENKENASDEEIDEENEEIYGDVIKDTEIIEKEEEKQELEIEEEEKLDSGTIIPAEKDKKDTKDKEKLRKLRIKERIEKDEKEIEELMNKLYNPEFLYRLLMLLYKCVTMGSDHVSIVIGNPKFISILFSLLKNVPPNHQIMLIKILSSLFEVLPYELFVDSMLELNIRNGIDKTNTKPSNDNTQVISISGSSKKGSYIQSTPHAVIQYLWNYTLEKRKRIFDDGLIYIGDHTVTNEAISLFRTLLCHNNWDKYMREIILNNLALSQQVQGNKDNVQDNEDDIEIEKQLAFAILGGEFNGLRYGGKVIISSSNHDELFEDNVLLKRGLEETYETGTILGFIPEYKEKRNEEEKKKDDKKQKEEEETHIKFNIGPVKEMNNPIVLAHSSISKEVSNFSSIELATMERYNVFSTDSVAFESTSFELVKHKELLIKYFKWGIDDSTMNTIDTKNLYLKALIMKSFNTFMNNQSNCYYVIDNHVDILQDLLNIACKHIVSSDPMNLELSEEKMFRLLQHACEGELNLSDLKDLTLTIKPNTKEIEVLLGKEFTNMKYSILNGFNLDKVPKYHEVIYLNNPSEFLNSHETDLIKYVSNKAILMDSKDITNEKYSEIILNAKVIITHGYDMQKFSEYWESNQVKSSPKKQNKEKKEENKGNMMMEIIPDKKDLIKQAKEQAKYPNCLVNVSEKSYRDLIKELQEQSTKKFKNVFECKQMIEELVEFGFPRDVCEQYLLENTSVSFDLMVGEIAKLIEQNEEEKLKRNSGEISNQQDKSQKTMNQQGSNVKSQQAGQSTEVQFTTSGTQGKTKGKVSMDEPALKKKDKKKGKEEDEEDEFMKKKKAMMMKEKGIEGNNAREEEKKEEEGPDFKIGDTKIIKQQQEPMIKIGMMTSISPSDEFIKISGDDDNRPPIEEKIGINISNNNNGNIEKIKSKDQGNGDIEDEDDLDLIEEPKDMDIQKEDANPCFKCKGEKEIQGILDDKNKRYDDIIDFESLNFVGKLITFKQVTHNLIIYYTRRIILNMLEKVIPRCYIENNTLRQQFIQYLRLITNEAIFSSGTFCNNFLINRLKKIIESIFDKVKNGESGNSTNSGNNNVDDGIISKDGSGISTSCGTSDAGNVSSNAIGNNDREQMKEFIDIMFNKCIIEPLFTLQEEYNINSKNDTKINIKEDKDSATKTKDKKKDSTTRAYTGRISNETEIDKPRVDFSLWLAQIMINSTNQYINKKILRYDILYLLFGLIPIIKYNKSLLWGVLIFTLNMIENLKNNIGKIECSTKNILKNENIIKIHDYFHILKSREKQESFSKRAQIIAELLLNLNRLQRAINSYYEINDAEQDNPIDLNKYKNIENLTEIVEMMENVQENKSLIATTWLQSSNELLKTEQKVIDGDHFYFKNLHTFKIQIENASEVNIKFSEDCQTDNGDSILFSSDIKGESSVIKAGGNLSKKTYVFPAGTFYVHFPTKGSDLIAFGCNEQYQFNDDTQNVGPVCLENFSSINTISVDGGDTHTMILNNNGELWSCGTGSQTGSQSSSSKTFTKISLKDKVKQMSCGSNFTIFITENNILQAIGSNADGRCGMNWNTGLATPSNVDFNSSKIIKQISCGFNHSLICTVDGQVYGTGSNEFGQLGINDENGNKINQMQSFSLINDISKKKVISICAAHNFSIILVKEKGKNMVMSCGEKASGKLGLGDDSASQVGKFTKIKELENIGVIFIHAKKKHSIAITNTGKIYSWGCGENGQLGHGTLENEQKPKQISFFENMKVISGACGANHTVILAKGRNDEYTKAYVFGDNTQGRLGLKNKEKISIPTVFEFFDDKNPMKVYTGTNHTVILTEPMKIPKHRDIHKYKCDISGVEPISGPIFVDICNNNKTYSSAAVNNEANIFKYSAILLFVKEAINPIKELTWPTLPGKITDYLDLDNDFNGEFKGYSCQYCKITPIKKYLYINIHQLEHEPQEYICNTCAYSILENQVSSTLYWRITRPLKQGKFLPNSPRTNFFNQSDTFGYNMTLVPKYNEKGHDYMMEKYKESFESFYSDMKNLKPEIDEQLVDLLNNICQKQEKSAFDLSENITFPKEEVSIRTALEKSSNEFLKKRFLILKNFNTKFKNILPFIDFSAKKDTLRLRNVYSNCSVYIFWDVKSELFEKILAVDGKPSGNQKIKINRMKASKFIQKGKPDHTGEYTVFGQIFQFFKSIGYASFKVTKESNPFSVQFVGEAAIDAGGPYREAISQIGTELQSSALPLLIPSPNQKNDSGLFREKWVLNPSATSLIHMQMYELLGAIMGCSIRTKNFLNLDLPSIVWKQLVDVPITRKDLENIDRYLIQCLDDVINIHKKGINEVNFNDIIQEKFVTTLSDGSEVELMSGGKSMMVTFERRQEWAELVEKARLIESKKQAEALRKGLSIVVPEGLLNLLTWRELETLVCGKPILDIDLLKTNTVYKGCSESDSVVEYFWKALTEYSPEERSMYLRFVWGRSRLPLTSKDFPMKHQIEILRKGTVDADMMLPVAHTCFFSIELPKYSTYEILRDKLKYAITHCQAIDTDGRAYEIWDDDE